jgi:hypothetical protein
MVNKWDYKRTNLGSHQWFSPVVETSPSAAGQCNHPTRPYPENICHGIGLKDKHAENPSYFMGNHIISRRFSLQPIYWFDCWWILTV